MKKFFKLFTLMFVMLGFDGLSSSDLAERAQYLGFDGDYIGQQDPLLSFDGNGNWFSGTMKSFTLTIINGTANNQDVVILPGYMYNPEKSLSSASLTSSTGDDEVTLDANIGSNTISVKERVLGEFLMRGLVFKNIFNSESSLIASDGIIFTDDKGATVTCQGNPAQVRELITYIINHPTWLTAIKMRTNNPLQFSQSFKLTEKSPFKKPEEHTILLEKFTSNKDFQNDLIDIEIGMTVNDLTRLSIDVVANSTLSMTFMFGASVNMGKYVDYSAQKASDTAVLYKQQPVKKLEIISQK